MRLTPTQCQQIRNITSRCIGATKVWLFGSRIYDNKKGGDVDLFVESIESPTLIQKIQCKIQLEENLGLPVDLVVAKPGQDKPIYRIAKAEGVLL